MNQISQEHLDRLMDDIRTIKSTMNQNRPLMKHLFLPAPLRAVGIVGGLSVIFFCLAFYFLNAAYGHHTNIPAAIRYTMYGLLLGDWIYIAVLKNRNILRSMRTVDPNYSVTKVFKYLHDGQLMHIYAPVAAMVMIFMFYTISNGLVEYVVPVMAIGMGLLYNVMGAMLRLKEYLYAGYWIIGTGTLAAVFPQVSPLIDCAATLGVGLFLFGALRFTPDETVQG